jgi:hypothetical protein
MLELLDRHTSKSREGGADWAIFAVLGHKENLFFDLN